MNKVYPISNTWQTKHIGAKGKCCRRRLVRYLSWDFCHEKFCRVGKLLFVFLCKSLAFWQKEHIALSQRARRSCVKKCEKSDLINCSSRSFKKSDKSDLLTTLFARQERIPNPGICTVWEFGIARICPRLLDNFLCLSVYMYENHVKISCSFNMVVITLIRICAQITYNWHFSYRSEVRV